MTASISASSPAGALARLRNRRVGFIFQAYHLLPELSAIENVMLPARMARLSLAGAEARARELLDRVGLGQARRRTGLMNCPAANSNAWPSPARSSTSRT